jgi:hypothetical protein
MRVLSMKRVCRSDLLVRADRWGGGQHPAVPTISRFHIDPLEAIEGHVGRRQPNRRSVASTGGDASVHGSSVRNLVAVPATRLGERLSEERD